MNGKLSRGQRVGLIVLSQVVLVILVVVILVFSPDEGIQHGMLLIGTMVTTTAATIALLYRGNGEQTPPKEGSHDLE